MNLQFSTLKEAWGNSSSGIIDKTKSSKKTKSEYQEQRRDETSFSNISLEKSINHFFSKYTQDYKTTLINEILLDYINKSTRYRYQQLQSQPENSRNIDVIENINHDHLPFQIFIILFLICLIFFD